MNVSNSGSIIIAIIIVVVIVILFFLPVLAENILACMRAGLFK